MNKWLQALSVLALTVSAAHAHTQLSVSVPADGATLSDPPKEVMLHFSEPVKLTMLTVQRDNNEKRNLGPLPTQANVVFTVAAPALEKGSYVVSWRALSEDTHVMTGEFTFSVGASEDSAASVPHMTHDQHAAHSEGAEHDEATEHHGHASHP